MKIMKIKDIENQRFSESVGTLRFQTDFQAFIFGELK